MHEISKGKNSMYNLGISWFIEESEEKFAICQIPYHR